MKLIFFLAFVGLAASASSPTKLELIRNATESMTYIYDVQIATGMEEVSDDFSTNRLRFTVQVARAFPVTILWEAAFVKLNILEKLNKTDGLPRMLLPLSEYRYLSQSELWFAIEEKLKLSFFFAFDELRHSVKQVKFREEDPFWSTNIKRGFLQAFDINVNTGKEKLNTINENWSDSDRSMTTSGDCMTDYAVERQPTLKVDDRIYFSIEKSIDFNKCRNYEKGVDERPGIWFGIDNSDSLNGVKPIIDISNVGKYEIAKHKWDARLWKASVRTVYTFSPFKSSMHGSQRVTILQKLDLVETGQLQHNGEDRFIVSQGMNQELVSRLPQQEDDWLQSKTIRQAFTWELNNLLVGDKVNMTHFDQILRITRFHINKVSELEEMVRIIKQQSNGAQKLKIFLLQILPQVNTDVSIKYLISLIRADNMSQMPHGLTPQEVGSICMKIGMAGNLQIDALRSLMKNLETEKFTLSEVNSQRLLPFTRMCWLSLASMTNTYFRKQQAIEARSHDLLSFNASAINVTKQLREEAFKSAKAFRQSFVQTIKRELMVTDERRLLAIKLIKNSGLHELYDSMRVIILQAPGMMKKFSLNERVEAIYATQKMLQRNALPLRNEYSNKQDRKLQQMTMRLQKRLAGVRRQIESDLLRCFTNIRDDPEVRTACYRVLIQSSVSQRTLHTLLQNIISEPRVQVKSYCVEHLRQVAVSKLARYQPVRSTVRSMLSMMQPHDSQSQSYHRLFQGQLWDDLHEAGLSIETDLQFSDTAFTPRTAHVQIYHHLMSRETPILEIKVRTTGLQQILEKFIGPKGAIYNMVNRMRLLRRFARSASQSNSEDPWSFMDIVPRILKELPEMDLGISILGNEVQYINLKGALTKGTSEIFMIKPLLSSITEFFSVGAGVQIPTPAGTILEMNTLMSRVFKPEVTFDLERLSSGVEVTLKVAAPLSVNIIHRIGSSMHVLTSDNVFNADLELLKGRKVEIKVQLTDDEIKIRDGKKLYEVMINLIHNMPSDRSSLVKFNSRMQTVLREWNMQEDGNSFVVLTNDMTYRRLLPVNDDYFQKKLGETFAYVNEILKNVGLQLKLDDRNSIRSGSDLYQPFCSFLLAPIRFEMGLKDLINEGQFLNHSLKLTFDVQEEALKTEFLRKLVLETDVADLDEDRKPLMRVVLIKDDFDSTQNTQLIKGTTQSRADSTPVDFQIRYSYPKNLDLPSSLDDLIQLREATVEMIRREFKMSAKWRTNAAIRKFLQQSEVTEGAKVAFLFSRFPTLKKCFDSNIGKRSLFAPSCLIARTKINELTDLEIELEDKSSAIDMWQFIIRNFAQLLQKNLVKENLKWKSAVQTRKLQLLLDARQSIDDSRVYHMTLQTPLEDLEWRSIQLPFKPLTWNGNSKLSDTIVDYVKGGSTTCQVMKRTVRTFDGVTYRIPKKVFTETEKRCGYLIAGDCSKSQSFQIIADNRGASRIIIRVKVEDSSKGLFRRNAQFKYADIVVTRNADMTDSLSVFSQAVNFVTPRVVKYDSLLKVPVVLEKMTYGEEIWYRISIKTLLLDVMVGGQSDLSNVHVNPSPFYHNKVCGLCGDYNSEQFAEFKGLDERHVLSTPEGFFRQYIQPSDDQCRKMRSVVENENIRRVLDLTDSSPKVQFSQKVPVCQTDGKFVRTFWKQLVRFQDKDIMGNILSRNDKCRLKVLEAEVGDYRVVLSLHAAGTRYYGDIKSNDLLISIFRRDEDQALISKSFREVNELRDFMSQHHSDVEVESIDQKAYRSDRNIRRVFSIRQRDQQLYLLNTEGSIKVEASHPVAGICNIEDLSQLKTQHTSNSQFAVEFLTSTESKDCARQLHSTYQQCRVTMKSIKPFAPIESQASSQMLPLSLDKSVNSVQVIPLSIFRLKHLRKILSISMIMRWSSSGKVSREYLVQHNAKTVFSAMMSVPYSDDSLRIKYFDSRVNKLIEYPLDEPDFEIDEPSLVYLGVGIWDNKVIFRYGHKNGFSLKILRNAGEIVIGETHSAFRGIHEELLGGLCQTNYFRSLRWHSYDSNALLRAVLEQGLDLEAQTMMSQENIMEEEQMRIMERTLDGLRNIHV